MEIALILKVAGVGILISVLNMILDKVDSNCFRFSNNRNK